MLLITVRSDLLVEIRWFVCMSSLCVLFSRTGAGLCIYHLFLWSNWNFFHISQWITLSTQSCLVLHSFYANLLHSLIMWLMFSPLSPHSLHLLFCCVLSLLALKWLIIMALFWAAIIVIIIINAFLNYPSWLQLWLTTTWFPAKYFLSQERLNTLVLTFSKSKQCFLWLNLCPRLMSVYSFWKFNTKPIVLLLQTEKKTFSQS